MNTVKRIRKSVTPLLIAAPMWLCGYTFNKVEKAKHHTCLEISGEVTKTISMTNTPVRVQLIEENKVVDSLQVQAGETFRFGLQKNKYYSIRIFQEGFVPRLVSISTYLPVDLREAKVYKFHFDLLQMSAKENTLELADVLDFPVAVVAFDETKGYFDYNVSYTSRIKDLYKKTHSTTTNYFTVKL